MLPQPTRTIPKAEGAALAAVGAALDRGRAGPAALIRAVHVGGDRAIGHGPEDVADVHRTHLPSR